MQINKLVANSKLSENRIILLKIQINSTLLRDKQKLQINPLSTAS